MLDGRLKREVPMAMRPLDFGTLLLQRTLLNLPRDMTLDSSLAASFFSATFRTFDGRDILPGISSTSARVSRANLNSSVHVSMSDAPSTNSTCIYSECT